jgi:hypothetical protein
MKKRYLNRGFIANFEILYVYIVDIICVSHILFLLKDGMNLYLGVFIERFYFTPMRKHNLSTTI